MNEALMIPIAALCLPAFIVPTALTMKHLKRKRELAHLERMRALELGRPAPGDLAWPAVAAIAIGAAMPLGAFLCAWLASLTSHTDESPWLGATFVGIAGVIGGTKLAGRLFVTSRRAPSVEPIARRNDKPPVYDPDAFDVVGRRG